MIRALSLAGLMALACAQTVQAGHPGTTTVWVQPQYEYRSRTVTVPAEFRTVTKKVWIEPVYQWREQRIWVPAADSGLRLNINVDDFAFGLNLGGSKSCGSYKTVRQRVCTEPGRWTTFAETVLVKPECRKIVYDKVCVREGYWRTANLPHCRDGSNVSVRVSW